jgi:hypothetical protein
MPNNANSIPINGDTSNNTASDEDKRILDYIKRAQPILFYNQTEELHMTSVIETWKEKRDKDLKKTEQMRSKNSWLWSQTSPDDDNARKTYKPSDGEASKTNNISPKK